MLYLPPLLKSICYDFSTFGCFEAWLHPRHAIVLGCYSGSILGMELCDGSTAASVVVVSLQGLLKFCCCFFVFYFHCVANETVSLLWQLSADLELQVLRNIRST